jgi:hypothetical protein
MQDAYLYLQSWREAAVLFNVPIPPEVRNSGSIKTWDEVIVNLLPELDPATPFSAAPEPHPMS